MTVAITGLGVVSALGPDTESFLEGLRRGRNPCQAHEFRRFDGSVVKAPAFVAATPDAKGLIDPRKLRRMSRLTRMAAVATRQALNDAGVDLSAIPPERIGVVWGTAFGALETTQKFVDSWIENGERAASPLQFMNSVHGILASLIALDLGATGVNLTLSQRDLSFESALANGKALLEQGRADILVVGGGDELTPMLHEFASRLYQVELDPARTVLDPYAKRSCTIPGEGAAAFVLERLDTPRKPKALLEVAEVRLGSPPSSSAEQTPETLYTAPLDGSARAARICEGVVPGSAISHRGFFGSFSTAGALQCAVNVLMLENREEYSAPNNPAAQGDVPPCRVCHLAPRDRTLARFELVSTGR